MTPVPRPLALVHGLGRFGGGLAAVQFRHRHGYAVRIADRTNDPAMAASLGALAEGASIDLQLGREDHGLLDGVDLLVVNPAVPDQHPLLRAAAARGIERTQEVNLFLAHYPGRVVGISGTNGKSSTATLLHAALQRNGIDALLGGNIGRSLLDDEGLWKASQIAVLEISSFQLERVAPEQRIEGAIMTRVGSDHLDRHGSLASYQAAKGRLAGMASAFFIHDAEDPVAEAFASPARHRIRFGSDPPGPGSMGEADGWLMARTGDEPAERLLRREAMLLMGDYQRHNALAAAAAARLLDADPHRTAVALATARPLPFRLQLAGVIDGVKLFDNAVSTEVESTRAALRNVPGRVHWVGGGKSKAGDGADVVAAIQPLAASTHLFGATAAALADRPLAGPVTLHERLEQALEAAIDAARPDESVLFSPGFASFDQFPNFRARAQAFHNWLHERRTSQG
ncbi:MAG: UDP-N-acetylmuramoyl-L-alanine--D-glutamate ligase [Planctomycetota bacterium]|nr:UDP-N-acetylmuramoyl-L-alanine--D-glutamate ligase [Planctomycetota bacterium]